MYSTSQPVSTAANGMGSDIIDGSGTINPAALNTAGRAPPFPTSWSGPSAWRICFDARSFRGDAKPTDHVATPSRTCWMSLADICSVLIAVLPPSATVNVQSTSPRGTKRSRSPEPYGDLPAGPEADDVGMLIAPASRRSRMICDDSGVGFMNVRIRADTFRVRRFETEKTWQTTKIQDLGPGTPEPIGDTS